MLIQKEFINKIKDFGLNSYEAKLWAALLSRGVATAGELSDIANVPRSRSYDVLESLERKGFIILKLGKPLKYIAVSPPEVIDRVKKNIKEEAERQEELINTLKKSEVLNELVLLHKEGGQVLEPSELTGIIKGRKNIYNHLATMIKTAEKSIFLITTEQGALHQAEWLYSFLKKAAEKNVVIKIAMPVTKGTAQHIKKFADVGVVKESGSVKTKVCVVDGKSAMVLADDQNVNPQNDFGIWMNTEVLAKGLETVFNTIWESLPLIKNTK